MPQRTSKPVSWLKPDPNQPGKSFDEGELRLLGESLMKQQRAPVLARPACTLIDGKPRRQAAKLVGLEQLDAVFCEGDFTLQQALETQLITALHRAALKPFEQFAGGVEWLRPNSSCRSVQPKLS